MTASDTVYEWGGTRYRTILSTADTGGAVSIIHGEAGPLIGPPTHVHQHEDEIFIVLAGEVTFDLAGQQFSRGAMGTAFLPRGIPHRFKTGDRGANCLTVLTPGGFEGFFTDMARGGFQLSQDLASVAEIANRYGSCITGPGLARTEVQDA